MLSNRLSKQQTSIADDCQRHEQALRSLERVQQEQEQVSAAERGKLETFVIETVDEWNKRITERDAKLRQDYIDKLSHLEQVT